MIKKHLLTKQKGIDSCSLLPQKWLVCLLTLLVTFVGSGRMWAQKTYLLSNTPTTNTDNYFNSNFADWSTTISVSYGDVTYTRAYKVESEKSVTFTNSNTADVTIVLYARYSDTSSQSYNSIKFDGKVYDNGITEIGATEIITINDVAAGSHTITRNAKETELVLVKVTEATSFSIPIKKWTSADADAEETSEDLSEYMIDRVGKGVNIGSHGEVVGMQNGACYPEIYAKYDDCKTLHFEGTPGAKVRLIYNYNSDSDFKQVVAEINSEGFVDFDIAGLKADQGLSFFHVNSIKLSQDSPSGFITKIEEKDFFTSYYDNYAGGGYYHVTYGTATLPTPTARSGYTFVGWADASTNVIVGNSGDSYTPTSSRQLNAQWEDVSATKYDVKYELFGHGSSTGFPTQSSQIPDVSPVDEYYNFEGWYTNQNLTQKAVAGTALEATTTLYAKWTKKNAIVPITDATVLTFTELPSNTINFDWYGSVQGDNGSHVNATAAGAATKTLKFDSKGSLTFNITEKMTLDLYFEDAANNKATVSGSEVNKTIKIDNNTYTIGENAHNSLTLETGNHTISRGNAQVLLYVLKLTPVEDTKASDLTITPPTDDIEINSNKTFTITTSSDGLLSIKTVSNNKISALIDDNGNLVVSAGTATVSEAKITIAQEASGRYEAGVATVIVNVVKPTLAAPTVTCADNLVTITSPVADATIYYTTDGSDPTTPGTRQVYTGPFLISASGTIKAYATANNYNDSEVTDQSVSYTEIMQYAYAVNAVDASGNIIKTFASGIVKDQPVTAYYPVIIKVGDTYYKTTQATYATTFAAATSKDPQTVNIEYVADPTIALFTESENAYTSRKYATISNDPNYSSGGGVGIYSGTNHTYAGTVDAGKYTLVVRGVYRSNRNQNYAVRTSTDKNNFTNKGTVTFAGAATGEQRLENFEIYEDNSYIDLMNMEGNNAFNHIDYYYLIRHNAITIISQPTTGNYGVGSDVELSVSAVAYLNGKVFPKYQWYSNTTESNEGGTLIEGATNETYKPSTDAQGRTYYYCVVSYTDGVNTISETTVPAGVTICPHTICTNGTIGAINHTSDWWTNFSPYYSLESGQSREFTFTAHTSKDVGVGNDNSWYLMGVSEMNHNGDTNKSSNYKEYMGIRSDRWDYIPNNMAGSYEGMIWTSSEADAWASMPADMDGANVNLRIARIDKSIYMYAKITATNGHVYYYTYNKELGFENVDDPLYLIFTIKAHSYIDNFVAYDAKATYKVSSAVSGEHGSVAIFSADGITIPENTYVQAGEKLIFQATPDAGYDDKTWTSDGTIGTIDPVNNCYIINSINAETNVTVEFGQHNMHFDDTTPTVNLLNDGTATYTQLVINAPVGEIPVYSVVESNGVSASISQEEGSTDYTLHVRGTGTVVVAASCGAYSATYTLTVQGLAFEIAYDTYKFNGNYKREIKDEGVTDEIYEISEKYGAIEKLISVTINAETGEISGLPEFDDNMGGALVIKASKGGSYATYTLTIPYKNYVWNFYQEGDGYSNTNPVSRIKTGPLVKNTNPGAADLVEMASSITDLMYDSNCSKGTVDDLKKKQTWLNMQKSDTEADASHYWNYTFKTCRYNDDRKTINYTNEALFSYKNAVHGDNARVITNTAGLVFNCDANKFGLNDNHTTVEPYMKDGQVYYNARQIREMDRAVLLQGYSSFTIPHVKKGYYVKLYWYRHSDNAGDQFRVENAKDLDGKYINPNDVLRFTGSAYFRNPAISDYRGCTFLQPAVAATEDEDAYRDITITIANSNWTELYRIEVTDKFESDLKICEEEIAGKVTKTEGKRTANNIGDNYAGTDMWNALDINVPENYNMQTHSHVASKLTSRIQTYAKGHQLIEYAPEIHFSGYPGHCFTWNGWMNTTIEATVEGSAKCASATNAENKVPNALPIDPIWVGVNAKYTAHHLKEVRGTGTIKLTLRTHSGWNGEPHYTLDKAEATVAVGEYSVQDYPYTWDFTKYNLNKTNKYGGKTFDVMNGTTNAGVNDADRYGNWDNHVMGAYTSKYYAGDAPNPQTSDGHKLVQGAERHKPFFAQGAQLNLGDGNNGQPRTILESEGLRINIPAVNADNNDAVTWTEGENGKLTVNGAITIPEVPEGMYVFVRSTEKPSVEGAIDLNDKENENNEITSTTVTYLADRGIDNNVTVALNQKDLPSNVWIYKQVNEANTDVVITPNAAVDGIGVTNYMKPMVQFKNMTRATYTTDARAESVDYHNTGFFTNHDLQAYVANNNADMKSQNASSKDSENGTITLSSINVIPALHSPLDGERGIMLEDVITGNTTPRPLLPLFVPACNLPEESLTNNKLIGCINVQKVPASTSTVKTYILTNQYYDWNWANNSKPEGAKNHIAGDAAFYINRENVDSRPNSAYLKVTIPSSVKQIYMILGEDDMDIDEPTAIEGIELNSSDNIISEPVDVYTLTGVKLNGMPTQKGVYVINGKKVLVK